MTLECVQKQLFFGALALFTLTGLSRSWNSFAPPTGATPVQVAVGPTLPPPPTEEPPVQVAVGPTLPPPPTEEPPAQVAVGPTLPPPPTEEPLVFII